jgi:transposase-like protein
LKKAAHAWNTPPLIRCRPCGATYTEEHPAPFRIEDYLRQKRGIMAIQLLLEGCSIRTVERITNLHHDAIMELPVSAANA